LTTAVKTFASRKYQRAADYLTEILSGEDKPSRSIKRILRDLRERVWGSSVKIKLGPILIEPAQALRRAGQRGAEIDLSGFIRDAANSLRKANQLGLVAIDRIDEIHKYDRATQQAAIQGLFLAEGYLAQIPGISLIIFLRSDLFKIYDIQEKNKLVSRTLVISWTKQDLLGSIEFGVGRRREG
jgi:hypothetical protein